MSLATQIANLQKVYVARFCERIIEMVKSDSELELAGMMNLWDQVSKEKIKTNSKEAKAKAKAGRKPTAYNIWLSAKIKALAADDDVELKDAEGKVLENTPQNRFKAAVAAWKTSPDNPKNKPGYQPKKKGGKRGRPKKVQPTTPSTTENEESEVDAKEVVAPAVEKKTPKKRRGRPKKKKAAVEEEEKKVTKPKPRGRKKKQVEVPAVSDDSDSDSDEETEVKRKPRRKLPPVVTREEVVERTTPQKPLTHDHVAATTALLSQDLAAILAENSGDSDSSDSDSD